MASHPQPRAPLVGRGRELSELEHALDRLAPGSRWMVQIVGEPGIGKSRLLAELVRRAEERGHLVLEGRAAEFEREVPFGLVVDALNDYAGALPRSTLRALGEETVAELAALLPSLAPLLPAQAPPRLEAERFRAHYAIRALLERLAADQPVVLALDDLHWADDESIEVIGHLIRRFRGPFLVALAFRQPPEHLAAVLDATGRERLSTRLRLAPLSAEDRLRPSVAPRRMGWRSSMVTLPCAFGRDLRLGGRRNTPPSDCPSARRARGGDGTKENRCSTLLPWRSTR